MITRAQKLRLALFFLVIVGLFSGFFLAVIGTTVWEQKDIYYIEYTDTSVSGLQVGGSVIYQGITVGTVKSIGIDPQNVENIVVTISLDEDTPIKEDVKAKLVPVGITGITQIELYGGTKDAALLEPGSYIEPGPATLTAVTDTVQSVLEGIETLLTDISEVISIENRDRFDNIMENVEGMVEENRGAVADIVNNLGTVTENLAATSERADTIIASLEKEVTGINLPEIGANFENVAAKADELVDKIDLIVLQRQDDIIESIELLSDTLRLLNNFAFQISENPSLLILAREE